MALYLPSAHGNPYTAFLARFRDELGAEHSALLYTEFEQHLLDQVDTHEMHYLEALVSPTRSTQWHAVEWHDERAQEGTRVEAADSLVCGVAAVLERLENFELAYTGWESNGDSVTFSGHKGPIATVSPFTFSQANPLIVERVRTALTGVRAHGDNARLNARLQKIPGFEDLHVEAETSQGRALGYSVLSSCKDVAAGVRRACAAVGVELKNSRCQEAVAHAVGAKNWATLVAAEQTHPVPQSPYSVVLPDGARGQRVEYLATGVEALARLATARAGELESRKPIHVSSAMYGGLITTAANMMDFMETESAGPMDVLNVDLDVLARASSLLDSRVDRPNVRRLPGNPKAKPIKALIGRFLVSLREFGHMPEGLMTITPVDERGDATCRPRSLILYKASVEQTDKGLMIMEDYSDKSFLDLSKWDPSHCAELLKFLGVSPEPQYTRCIPGLLAHG